MKLFKYDTPKAILSTVLGSNKFWDKVSNKSYSLANFVNILVILDYLYNCHNAYNKDYNDNREILHVRKQNSTKIFIVQEGIEDDFGLKASLFNSAASFWSIICTLLKWDNDMLTPSRCVSIGLYMMKDLMNYCNIRPTFNNIFSLNYASGIINMNEVEVLGSYKVSDYVMSGFDNKDIYLSNEPTHVIINNKNKKIYLNRQEYKLYFLYTPDNQCEVYQVPSNLSYDDIDTDYPLTMKDLGIVKHDF